MDEVKQLLLELILHDNETEVIEIFNNYEMALDESFFDYELLKAALNRRCGAIAKFLINKGCRVRSPNKINLDKTPLHLAMELLDHSVTTTMLNKDINIIYDKNLNGETPLYTAFKKKNYRAISAVLDYISNCNLCFNPNNKDDVLHFHIACIRKHMSSVKLYLSLGFDVNSHLSIDSTKYSGLTPLLYLLTQDDYNSIVEFVQVFINSGVDVNSSIPLNYHKFAGFTPLHFAVKNVFLELVELLLKNGADCNRPNKNGKTPLHVACKNFECDEALEIIKILLDYSANPVAVDNSRNTPIHLTFSRILHHSIEEADILDRLISKQPLKDNLTDKNGISFFHIVCTRNEPDRVNEFLNSGVTIDSYVSGSFGPNFEGYTALHFAVHFNQKAVVEVLLKRNASVNKKTYHELYTPLHLACEFSRLKFFEVYREYENIILNDQTRNVNVDWIANRTNHLDIVKLLLLYGADVEAKCSLKFTPLFTLCHIDKDATTMYPDFFVNFAINEINVRLIEIANILLSNKANINCENDYQWSIMHILSVNDLSRISDELMKCLITAGADINAVDRDGLTPLHDAATMSKEMIVQTFLKYKANVNVKSKSSETPLEMAISSYIKNSKDDEDNLLESSQNCIITLLENGSDVNIKTKTGRSLLHIAVTCSSPFLIEKLLNYGADINIEDSLGNSIVCSLFTDIEEDMMNVLCVIFMHVQKLLALRLYVCNKVKYFCTYLHQYYKTTLAESIYNRILDSAFDKCINELNRMKNEKIDNYTTLYNVLVKDVHKLSNYARNQNYIDTLERENINEEFPLYSYLLKLQYKKSLLRRNVVKFAKESLKHVTNTNLPDMCYDSVLRYLTNEEIVNLKVAVDTTDSGTSKRKLNVLDISETNKTIKLQKTE